MKFCPNCGTQIDDNAVFCGNCGASVQNGTQAPNSYTQGGYGSGSRPPKKSKMPLLIAAIVVLCLAIGVGVFFVVRAFMGGGKGPRKADEKDFVGIQTAFFEERFGGIGAVSSSDSFSSDITVSGRFDSSDPDAQKINRMLEGSAVIFKTDVKKNDLLTNIILNLQGSNVLEADLTLTDKEFGFALPAADGNYYVGDLKTVMQNFGASEKEIDSLLNLINMKEGMKPQLFTEAFKSVLNAGINDKCLTITKKATVNLDKFNESVEGTLYVWQPTKEDCKAVMEKFADELETGASIGALMKQLEQMGGNFSLNGAPDDWEEVPYENAEEMIQNFRANTDKYAQEMFDSGFKWEMATDATGKVVMICLTANEVQMGYQGLVTDQNANERFYITRNGAEQVRIDHQAAISGKQWTGTVTFGTPYGALPVNYSLDTSKYSVFGMPYGNVNLSLAPFAGTDITLDITTQAGASSSTDMIIKVTGIGMLNNNAVDSVEITVNTTEKSSAAKPSGTKVDISNYTEEDYKALFESMGRGLVMTLLSSPALSELMQLFY